MPEDQREVFIKHKNYSLCFIGHYYDPSERWFFRGEVGHIDASEIIAWHELPALNMEVSNAKL